MNLPEIAQTTASLQLSLRTLFEQLDNRSQIIRGIDCWRDPLTESPERSFKQKADTHHSA